MLSKFPSNTNALARWKRKMSQFSFQPPGQSNIPKPPKRVLILGGGTAGWMSASLLAKMWQKQGVEITLLESDTIGTIGVGEGTTPSIKAFFDILGIDEQEWMRAANATFKTGIRFNNWSDRPEFESYFHPFFSQLDQYWDSEFRQNMKLKQQGYDVLAHPDTFFPMASLAKYNKAPIAPKEFPFGMHYAYHFDAGLLAKFLQKKAEQWGVKHAIGTVSSVDKNENGDIQRVNAKDGASFDADLFIDCSGFRSVLLGESLEVPYNSFSERLLNDSAVTIATDTDIENLPSITQATALKAGWAWKIPLTSRVGNGYVYSSKHIDASQAEKELREHLGLKADDG
jgi:flavin-dependent dehydrogenase